MYVLVSKSRVLISSTTHEYERQKPLTCEDDTGDIFVIVYRYTSIILTNLIISTMNGIPDNNILYAW